MKSLKKPVFTPLPISNLQPQGWLLKQLQIQAEGLSGNLDKFWPDIKDSKWFGGDKEGWERVPCIFHFRFPWQASTLPSQGHNI